LFCDGLDGGAHSTEDEVDEFALMLERSCDESVTATTSLNFAAVENSEGEAAIPARA
jgi:hypothetical protein